MVRIYQIFEGYKVAAFKVYTAGQKRRITHRSNWRAAVEPVMGHLKEHGPQLSYPFSDDTINAMLAAKLIISIN